MKSRDLAPDRARCADEDCPSWESGCARAEHQLGLGRFTWLALRRPQRARYCNRRIDPVTLQETGNRPAEGIVDV
jgi:hypothetical protein